MRTARRAVLCILLTLVACQRDADHSFQEPEYGKATCAQCGSIVQDPGFAASYRTAEGVGKVFDDPGCLFVSLRTETRDPVKLFFHERTGTRWLPSDAVSFAKTPATKSPQAYGWAAYGSFGDAQTAVTSAGAGEILSFAQAQQTIGSGAP